VRQKAGPGSRRPDSPTASRLMLCF
jgi:hypothetical protein